MEYLNVVKSYLPQDWRWQALLTGAVLVPTLAMAFRTKTTWNPKGKVVVITGCSSGIGKSLALFYAKRGAKLAINARREAELNQVAEECKLLGAEVITIVADVGIQADCKKVIDVTVNKYGAIDLLVLNAGVSMGSLLEELEDISIMKKIMDVDYFQCVYCTHYALPHLIKSNGKITVISSIAGLYGTPSRTGYSAAKFAVNGFFEALRLEMEFKKRDVQITIICPGPVKTDINRTRLGATHNLDMSTGITADEAAALVDKAIQERINIYVFGALKWVPLLKNLFPSIIDKIFLREVAKMMIKGK